MALNLGTLSVIFTSDTRGLERGFRRAEKAFDRLERKSNNLGKTLNRNIDKAEQSLESLGAKTRHTAAEMEGLGMRGRAPVKDMERKVKRLSGSLDPLAAKAKKSSLTMRLLSEAVSRSISNFSKFIGKMRVVSFTLGTLVGTVIALKDELVALGGIAAGVFVNVQLEPIRERMVSISDTAEIAESRLNTLGDMAAEVGANFITMGSQMGDAVAALDEAGFEFQEAASIAQDFTEAVVTLGGSSSDAGDKLEDLAELAKQGKLTMEDFKDAVEFTNDPLQTLANAFNTSEDRIQKFMETGQSLSTGLLPALSDQLSSTAGDTDTLTSEFNRVVEAGTDLFKTFNQAGVVDSLKGQLKDLANLMRSDLAENAILKVADDAKTLISQTLPNLAQSFVTNWDTILASVKAVAGFLVGSALGGIGGGLLGAIIGGTERTKAIMTSLSNIINSTVVSALIEGFGFALELVIDKLELFITKVSEAFDVLGKFIGRAAAAGSVGGDTLEAKLENAKENLKALREERDRLQNRSDNTVVDPPKAEERIKELDKQINQAAKRVRNLEMALKTTFTPSDFSQPFDEFFQFGQFNLLDFLDKVKAKMEAAAAVDMSEPFKEFLKPGGFDMASFASGISPLPELQKNIGADPFRQFMQPGGFDVSQLTPNASLKVEALAQKLGTTIDKAQRLQTAADGIGDAFVSAFDKLIVQAEDASKVLDQLGKQIASTILRQQVSKPLSESISRGAGNLLGSLFTGGGGGGTTPASGFIQSGGGRFAQGGVTDKPAMFGESGPEAAVPLPDGRNIPVNMKGSGTVVNVINKGESEPQVQRRKDGNTEIVDVVIPAVRSGIESGELDGAFRKRFGTRPKPEGRS